VKDEPSSGDGGDDVHEFEEQEKMPVGTTVGPELELHYLLTERDDYGYDTTFIESNAKCSSSNLPMLKIVSEMYGQIEIVFGVFAQNFQAPCDIKTLSKMLARANEVANTMPGVFRDASTMKKSVMSDVDWYKDSDKKWPNLLPATLNKINYKIRGGSGQVAFNDDGSTMAFGTIRQLYNYIVQDLATSPNPYPYENNPYRWNGENGADWKVGGDDIKVRWQLTPGKGPNGREVYAMKGANSLQLNVLTRVSRDFLKGNLIYKSAREFVNEVSSTMIKQRKMECGDTGQPKPTEACYDEFLFWYFCVWTNKWLERHANPAKAGYPQFGDVKEGIAALPKIRGLTAKYQHRVRECPALNPCLAPEKKAILTNRFVQLLQWSDGTHEAKNKPSPPQMAHPSGGVQAFVLEYRKPVELRQLNLAKTNADEVEAGFQKFLA
jgi:hypothetical protein